MIDLSRYDLPVETPQVSAVPLPADFIKKAGELMTDAAITVNETYPPGAREWLKINRKDISEELAAQDAAIDASFASGDLEKFRQDLDVWRRFHLRAWRVYRAATP